MCNRSVLTIFAMVGVTAVGIWAATIVAREAAKKDRLKKSGKAAQIVLDYDNILKSELAKATPMQKIVINDALNTLTDITAHLRMTFQPQ